MTRADGVDNYILYSYTDTNITGRKFYDRVGQHLIQVDSVQYTASGKISRMVSWLYEDPFFWDTARVEYQFEYSSQKLYKVTELSAVFSPLGTYYDTVVHVYHFNAAGNVEKLVLTDAQQQSFDSVTYVYNNHPNYFSAVHPHFFLFDPYFELQVGFPVHFPYFYSRNNVTDFTLSGNLDYQVSYGLDSLNKVTAVDLDGFEYMKYKFQCQ